MTTGAVTNERLRFALIYDRIPRWCFRESPGTYTLWTTIFHVVIQRTIGWQGSTLDHSSQQHYEQSKEVAVDEAMIKFQGHSSLKQYMPKKPIKRGIKVWVLGDSTNGYFSRFDVYTGKGEGRVERTCWNILCVVQVGVASSVAVQFTISALSASGETCSVVARVYFSLFHYMEDTHILSISNEVHMYCLHYIFLNQINSSLHVLRCWNNHPLSSEHARSPIQLWVQGLSQASSHEELSNASIIYKISYMLYL